MAFASSRSMAEVWREPYRQTLHEFYHQQQLDRIDDLRHRGNALHLASLMAIAFHDPKKLGDEHRQLLRDAGLAVVIDNDAARANALALIADVEQVDDARAWVALEVEK